MNVSVLWLFLTLPCVGLQYVIGVFPDHTHLLFDGKKELVALLYLSFWCHAAVIVLWFFLMVTWVALQFVIVVFPDHTHLPFCSCQGQSNGAQ